MTASDGEAERTPSAVDHLELVAGMTGDFADSQDIDTTLGRGLARIAQELDAEAASLFLRGLEDPGTLICRACYGPVDITGLRLSADTGIVGRAVSQQSSELVRDVQADPDFGAAVDAQTGFTTRSILCAPMRVRGETLGAIELINKLGERRFDDADRRLLETLASAAALAVINARMADAMAERARLKREVELAAAIQRSFLPAPRPDGFPVHGVNRPAREASGDFFDILELPDGRIWFDLGDVSGKGVNAALIMAKTVSLFRHMAKRADDPWEVLHGLNAALHEVETYGMFVTMICGVLEPAAGTVRLANAGHEPALLQPRVSGGGTAERLPAATPPLGILERLDEAPAAAGAIALSGRRLYLYSDGLTDQPGPDGAELGTEGLIQAIAAAEGWRLGPQERLERVLAAAAPADGPPADDLTLLVVDPGDAR
jgi:sigma-B regulation protein RsbU (phosphoserine phosphatase)